MKTTKLILAAAAAALVFASCEKEDTTPNLAILTFEDQDYKGEAYTLDYCKTEVSTWSDLIAEKQYDDDLLYGYKEGENYWWFDQNNTFLKGQSFSGEWVDQASGAVTRMWNCGHAISNFVETNIESAGFMTQLSVPAIKGQANGGHNGSRNFCIHYGYAGYPGAVLPALEFGDKQARVIDHLWVNNTAYTLNALLNGDGMTGDFGENDWFKIVATGFNGENKTGEVEFFLGKGNQIIKEWTRWNLAGLGKVTKVQFDLQSSKKNEWGMTTPAYFAFDDVAVRMK